MNHHNNIIFQVFRSLVPAILFMLSYSCDTKNNKNKVAEIGGDNVYIAYLDSYIKSQTSAVITDSIRNIYLPSFIDSMVIEKEIDRLGLHKLYAITEKLKLFRTNMLAGQLRTRYLKENIYTYENFDSLNTEMAREFDMSQIFIGFDGLYGRDKIRARVLVDSLYSMIPVSGFEQIARIYSDDKPSKSKGGRMSTVRWPMMDTLYQNSVRVLDSGEYTKPVEIRNGFIIIRLNQKKISPVGNTIDNITQYGNLAQKIWRDKIDKELNQYMTDLKKKYNFTFNFDQAQAFIAEYNSIADTFPQEQIKLMGFSKIVINKMKNDYQLATFDGRTIDLDWMMYYQDRYQIPLNDVVALTAFVDQFTNYEVLVKEAESLGLDKTKNFELAYNNYRNELIWKRYKKDFIQSRIVISESDIQEYYAENIEQFEIPPVFRVIETPSDPGNEGPETRKEKIRFIGSESVLGKRLINLKIGQVSKPMRYKNKYYTYELVELIPKQVKLISEVKNTIISSLQKERYGTEKNKIIKLLHKIYKVNFDPDMFTLF